MLVNDKQRMRAWLEDRLGTSDTRATEKEWLAIWKVNVPAKIRVFLWRLARHSLSSGDVLHHRNMAPEGVCAICDRTAKLNGLIKRNGHHLNTSGALA